MKESVDYWISTTLQSIIKQHVLGYMVTRHRTIGGSNNPMDTILVYPMTHDEDTCEELEIEPTDEIVGIIPAQPKSFIVRGLMPDDPMALDSTKNDNGTYEILGYEFEGASNPNWKSVLATRIRAKRNEVEE